MFSKILRHLSKKLAAKFSATIFTCSYFMVKIARLEDAFSAIFELEVSLVESQSLPQKDSKRCK